MSTNASMRSFVGPPRSLTPHLVADPGRCAAGRCPDGTHNGRCQTSGKKIRRKAKKKAQQRCLAQVGQCGAFFVGRCESPDPGECEARIARCCEFLGSCDTASFLSCLLETS